MEIKPETDRELLLQLNSDVRNMKNEFSNSMDRLIETVGRFERALVHLEDGKINSVIKKQEGFDDWKQQISGGWKVVVIIWIIITTIGVGAIVKLFDKLNN